MRVIRQTRDRFEGTHKGCSIDIERETDPNYDSTWYIRVRTELGGGGHLYDGWAPPEVHTMAEAKREAIAGACLDEPKPKRERKPQMLHGLPVTP